MHLLPLLIESRKPMAAAVRAKADRLVAAGRYAEASTTFLLASKRYGELGDPHAAQILRDYSRRYRTDAVLYVDDAPKTPEKLARLEPAAGCYLGANVEREDGADRDPATFSKRVGRHHALFFVYRGYGSPFPKAYAQRLKRIGAGLQIAWEPQSLRETQDEKYLVAFMRDAKKADIPVFLRFASEMNGSWTRYHGDPAAYRAAFGRVAAVAHAEAPNVAMVWCPAASPEQNTVAYYPGEEAVDWVGVNFLSVLYSDGDRNRPAGWRHPEDWLDFIYKTYAGKHPMMVGEWAASRKTVVDRVDRPEFAAIKIAQLYSAIPRRYPRVKAVHWLSLDALRHPQGNDFTLLGDPAVVEAYAWATREPFYLERIGDAAPSVPRPLKSGDRLPTRCVLSAYARSYSARPRVTILIDGKTEFDEKASGPHRVEVALSPGKHQIELIVRDDAGKVAGKRQLTVAAA